MGALAAPARAADVNIGGFQFNPGTVTVNQGETVTWHYMGPDTNHSVTSQPGQADSWDSDPGKLPSATDHPIGTTFARQFDVPGSFTYVCKVHSSMRGTVRVNGPGGEPPPGDTTAPLVSALSAKGGRACARGAKGCHAKATTVRYSLSEAAAVKLVFARRGGKTRTVTRAGTAGRNSIKRSVKQLPPGTYKLAVTATDPAGNVSTPAKTTVKVTRRKR
jgi:plastocyanin